MKKPKPLVMTKMKQENYAQKLSKKCCNLFMKPLMRNKIHLFIAGRTIKTDKRHIELKVNAAAPDPAAPSNYILSIIFI